MSDLFWPGALLASSFRLVLSVNQRAFVSPGGGSEFVVDKLNDRWLASLSLPPSNNSNAGLTESFIGSMRGMGKTVALWHMGRPNIAGTLTSATAQAAIQGAAQIVLNATTGQTLKAGDMLGIGGLLLQTAADCTASAGAITVPLTNRLRKAITVGAAVTLTRPTADFRLITKGAAPLYQPGYAESISLEFAEAIA